MSRVLEVFLTFLRLGVTSFGGPVAHLGFFREAFVEQKKWLDEQEFTDTLALCQFLPGPASSQLGFAIGLKHAGMVGAFAAWVAFTLPSALVMIAFGLGVASLDVTNAGWLNGLKVAVVIVVARAVWGMARTLCPERIRMTLAILCAIFMLTASLLSPSLAVWAQMLVIAGGGLIGLALFRKDAAEKLDRSAYAVSSTWKGGFSWIYLVVFGLLLVLLPVFGAEFFSAFYRGGALVFGGGHVVLPLLRESVVEPAWMTDNTFMAGYGAVQAMPGPLFTISAYLGTVSEGGPMHGVSGGFIALIAIFLPSWLLILGGLSYWERMRRNVLFAAALQGANAAVVGILTAALYHPVWTTGITGTMTIMVGLILFVLITWWKVPPWGAVLIAAGLGQLLL